MLLEMALALQQGGIAGKDVLRGAIFSSDPPQHGKAWKNHRILTYGNKGAYVSVMAIRRREVEMREKLQVLFDVSKAGLETIYEEECTSNEGFAAEFPDRQSFFEYLLGGFAHLHDEFTEPVFRIVD